ncbi:MAG: hypothetical protein HUJ97_07900, partial [Bacteroidales bacterium]|nr:hypothetical protein [Bacteroidales bacterium]
MKIFKKIYLLIFPILFLTACSRTISVDRQLGEEPDIFPDYKDVTIPCNIAPMDFQLLDCEGFDTQLIISVGEDELQVEGEEG